MQDLAENHLDGVFYGSFPSGNGINGSDFVAELYGYHNKIFAPQTIVGTANKANGGVGGDPVGAVHSGHLTPIVRRVGSAVAGLDHQEIRLDRQAVDQGQDRYLETRRSHGRPPERA